MAGKRKTFYPIIPIVLLVLFILPAAFIFTSCERIPKKNYFPKQITLSLEDYLKHGGEAWFLTGKSEYAVQAMMVSEETSFHNDLEMVDYTVSDDGVTVVLKGRFGEMWAAERSKVIAAYTKPDGTSLCEEDFAEKDKYIDIISKPEPDSYYAMYVPLSISVTVDTARGDVLHTNLPNAPHGEGDYLVCRAGINGRPDLSDIWVLNGVVFPEYYDTRRQSIKTEEDAK